MKMPKADHYSILFDKVKTAAAYFLHVPNLSLIF